MHCLVVAGLSSTSLLAVPENVATQGTIIFVSGSITDKPPSMLIDGISNDSNNRWGSNGMPQTLVIDLGGTFDLSRFEAFPYFSRAYRYTIEGSLDNSTFTTLVNRSQNTTASATIADDIQATSARYVRFKVTGANPASYTGSWVTFLELKCFGTPSLEPTNNDPQIIDSDLLVTGGLRVDAGLDLVTQGLSIFSTEALYSNGTAPSITLGYDLNGNPNFSLFNTDPTIPTASGLLLDPTNSTAEFRNTNVAITGSLSLNGSEVVTSSNASTALASQGYYKNVAAPYAFAAPSSLAGGFGSFAGATGQALGERSVAFGYSSQATGDGSTSIGSFSKSIGISSFALGYGAETAGYSSVAIGGDSLAVGDYSLALGSQSKAQGSSSVSIGEGSSAGTQNEIAIGSYNLESWEANNWIELDPIFRVGNGRASGLIVEQNGVIFYDFNEDRSDAITTLKNGQTTLTNKQWKMLATGGPHLSNPSLRSASEGRALVVDGHAVFNGKLIMALPQGDISMGAYGGSSPDGVNTLINGLLEIDQIDRNATVIVGGLTFVAENIEFEQPAYGGGYEGGELYELTPEETQIPLGHSVGDETVLSDGRILEITSFDNGIITFVIADQ